MKTAKQRRETTARLKREHDARKRAAGLVTISGWSTKEGRDELHKRRDEILAECK